MDADGKVWLQDSIYDVQAWPSDRDGDVFVTRMLLWSEIASGGIRSRLVARGEELSEQLALPRLNDVSDDDSRYWSDGITFLAERTVCPEGDLKAARPWTAVGSRDPEIRSVLSV